MSVLLEQVFGTNFSIKEVTSVVAINECWDWFRYYRASASWFDHGWNFLLLAAYEDSKILKNIVHALAKYCTKLFVFE